MITIPSAGGYDKLVYKPLKRNEYTEGANVKLRNIPKDDLVTVKTHGCGVNYADICIRWGLYESAKQFVGWPITPGFEFSGEVASKGANVDEFEIGDQVLGVSLFGSYSECIRVPKNQIFKLPSEISLDEAAGFPCVGLTAWYAMFELAQPRPGTWVLVHSAAGGVGSMLVQLAKIAGCHVVGVVGAAHKVGPVEQLGCDHVIDKSTENLWEVAESYVPGGFQAVFDANGVATLTASYNHLAPAGRLIVYGFHTMLPRSSERGTGNIGLLQWLRIGWNYLWMPRFNPMEMTSANKSIMGFNLSFMFDHKDRLEEGMKQLLGWVKKRSLKVNRVKTYPLCDVSRAHRDLESGQTVGKLVLTMGGHSEEHSKLE